MNTSAPVVVTYEPRGACRELFAATEDEIVISGPAGTGKSVAALFRMHLAALNNPGFRGLIVRKTAVSLGSTTLVTFKEKVAAEALRAGIAKWYGGSTQEAACYRYNNGSVIVVGGLDKPMKIMSSEYDLVFADEATELTITDWEAISTRLRNGKRARQQQIAACNPDSEHHWINQRATEGRLRLLYSTHRDNPAYVNADGTYTPAGHAYIEGKLSKLTGIRRKRLYEGKWTSAEGLVYDGWDPAIHLLDRLPKGSEAWTRWWTVDFGFSNPFVCQFWAEDGDGRLYLYREIYRTKRLVEDHALDILATVRRRRRDVDWKAAGRDPDPKRPGDWEWTEPRPRQIICDHDAEDRATLERHLDMPTSPAHKTVKDGVQAVAARLKTQDDGKPRLYIVRNALVSIDPELEAAKKPLCTEQEVTGYVWPEGVKPDQREVPVKEDDHGCLVAGMRVETDRGPVPIEDVRSGDWVLTRAGLKAVAASGMTLAAARVYRAEMSNGAVIAGTGNHPIWVSEKGWVRLDALRYGDRITACQTPNPYASTESLSAATPIRRLGPTASTSVPAPPTGCAASMTYTERYGNSSTGLYQTAARSITPTLTRSTTTRTTSSASQSPSTRKPTASVGANAPGHRSTEPISNGSGHSPSPGTSPMRDGRGTAITLRSKVSASTPFVPSPANTAAPNTRRKAATARNDSAPTSARPPGVWQVASTTSSAPAPSAEQSSPSTATRPLLVADVHVLSVCELAARVPVFNLTVADVPEYFAEGVLVHNCDAMRYMVAERDLGAQPRYRSFRR